MTATHQQAADNKNFSIVKDDSFRDVPNKRQLGSNIINHVHVESTPAKSQKALHEELKVGVMLPFSDAFMYSKRRVKPAVEMALSEYLPLSYHTIYLDSRCRQDYCLNELYNLKVTEKTIHLLLGPVCDYCLSPVANQLLFWNVPTISPGGIAKEFSQPDGHTVLTRVGLSGMEKLAAAAREILQTHNLTRVLLLYDPEGQGNIIDLLCHFLISAFHKEMEGQLQQDYYKFQGEKTPNFTNILKQEVGFKFSVGGVNYTNRIGVILPESDDYHFSIHRCVPAIRAGIEEAYKRQYLDRDSIQFSIEYQDSKCDGVGAPLAAFHYITNGLADVFFGPVCDYSLAPVARFSPVWNIPVISPGGMASDFGAKTSGEKEFGTLTRVGDNFYSLRDAYSKLMETYEWKKTHLIYDAQGQNYVMEGFCHLAMASLRMLHKIENVYYNINEKLVGNVDGKFNATDLLVNKIGSEYGGKIRD
ncbi:uncharacterized protein [Watersipora subatra]|uniref:uncharacterized protein n=1 Tax=Watersipora subatra TaxID=2589382 RepID=UPI00355B3395